QAEDGIRDRNVTGVQTCALPISGAAFELELEGRTRLRHEKVAEEDAVFQRGISMRYQGQWRSLQVKMGSGPNALDDAVQLFHEEHEKHYAFRQDERSEERRGGQVCKVRGVE